jgi:aminoglycoside 6'-N-acetyltransferase I
MDGQETGMAVRPVRPADAQEWLRLRLALWPGGRSEHAQEIAAYFQKARGDVVTLVAAQPSGMLGGMLELGSRRVAEGCRTSPVAYVEGLYVDPDLRRRGVASALLAAAKAWATAKGYQELASDAVPENAVSLAWHGSMGFEEVERIVCFRMAL